MMWDRCVALVDMVSFFASIEQLDQPHLRGKPIAVTNGESGSTIITSSYEARAFGVKTGDRFKLAKLKCPNLIKVPSRPRRYTEVSVKIIDALKNITPELEVFSVDESFMDLRSVLSLYAGVDEIADHIRLVVSKATGGLSCSIGISEGKLTAKFCAKCHKGGATIVPADKIRAFMADSPIEDICGIGPKIAHYLHQHGVYDCGDMRHIPMSVLSSRFGHVGRRLYLTCLGHDPEPLQRAVRLPKRMGHSKILPPATCDRALIWSVIERLCERLAARLRHNQLTAQWFWVGFKTQSGWLGQAYSLVGTLLNSDALVTRAQEMFELLYQGQGTFQVQVCVKDIRSQAHKQLDLFDDPSEDLDSEGGNVDEVKDCINHKFGPSTLVRANMLQTQEQVEVIAPAWRPDGARQSIERKR